MVNKIGWFGILGILCLGTLASSSSAEELPEAAKKALLEKYKDAKDYQVKTETLEGQKVFEVGWKDKDGLRFEVELTAEGKIVSEEHEVKATDLPKPVTEAITKKYPGATIKMAGLETVKGTTLYEVDVKQKDGKELELRITQDGSKIEEEKDEKDD